MADNFAVLDGAGASKTIRTTDNAGVHTPHHIVSGTVAVTDNSGSLTVDAPVGTPVFVRLSDGSSAIATLPVSLATIPAAGLASGFVQVTRPANTTAYAIGDVVGAAAAAWTFPNFVAGEILITSVSFYRGSSALESGEGSYTLHLYSVTPPSALADNAAWDLASGDRASYLGRIDLGAPVDQGGTVRVDVDQVNKQITSAGTSLYGYLVTNAAYTPQSASTLFINIHGVRV